MSPIYKLKIIQIPVLQNEYIQYPCKSGVKDVLIELNAE